MPRANVSNFDRRGKWRSWVWGGVVTLLVLGFQYAGYLDFAERWFFDQRARWCQLFRPHVPPQVAVVLIDQRSLDRMGAWPWPRELLADVIREIDRCGARVIALDVLVNDARDGDAALTDAIASSGKVVIPIELDLARPKNDETLLADVRTKLTNDLELWPEEIAPRVNASLDRVRSVYDEALHRAMIARINVEIAKRKSDEEIRAALLPKTFPQRSPLMTIASGLIARVRAVASARQRLPIMSNLPPLLSAEPTENIAIEQVIVPAAAIGFVDFKSDPGGKLRWLPLLARFGDDRVIAQFALTAAALRLGVDLHDGKQFQVSDDQIILQPPGASTQTFIPISTVQTTDRQLMVGTRMEVPMYGRRNDPYAMLDDRESGKRYVIPATRIGDVVSRTQSLVRNNAALDRAIRFFLRITDVDELARFDAQQRSPDDFASRRVWLMKLASDPFLIERDAEYRALKPEELDKTGRDFVDNFRGIGEAAKTNDAIVAEIEATRRELREILDGRVVVIGFAASGRLDQVATALHDLAPGAMVHAAVANAILTSDMWRRAPRWQNFLATAAMGALATWLVTCRGQYRAHLAAIALMAAYALVNGFILFDYGNYILAMASPIIAVGGVWSAITARRALIEAFDRAKVESEFRTYVDPALVDYVLANKQRIGDRIRAQRREMSIVFLDMEGFTTGAEKLGARAARVVNFYMTLMVTIIRANGGYVNKFLGDGIMFFFNAPQDQPDHAARAVRTVLEIQSAIRSVTTGKHKRKRTGFRVRAGISTGVVTVGDAGSRDASDYTVLGDIANLGSRLESANKQFGTACLAMARTVAQCNGEFLMRPLGRFRVHGRAEPVEVWEPLARTRDTNECQRESATVSSTVIQHFAETRFEECIAAIDRLEAISGSTKLTRLYRIECERRITMPTSADVDGVIDLASK